MPRHFAPFLACVLIAAGCASGPPFIDQAQPNAIAEAVRRGQFDFNCQSASGEVVRRDTLAPAAIINPSVSSPTVSGPLRAQYTIDVSGCGKHATYSVLCSEYNNQCIDIGLISAPTS